MEYEALINRILSLHLLKSYRIFHKDCPVFLARHYEFRGNLLHLEKRLPFTPLKCIMNMFYPRSQPISKEEIS